MSEQEETVTPYRNPYVSDATRERAAEWYQRRKEVFAELGIPWVAPAYRAETDMGEVEYEWRHDSNRCKHFSVAIEVKEDGTEEIWYMRVDDDEAADMPDGDGTHYDVFRLLWYWLWH